MTPGETITSEQLAGELAAARRTLELARFRLNQDQRAHALNRGGVYGPDRDLWRRWKAALRHVRYLELLSA